MKKIWVNGTFDVLHIGHIKLLEYASTLGSVRVGIDSDNRVREKKENVDHIMELKIEWNLFAVLNLSTV
jgi:cytidyltransferase-like protein